MIDVIGLIYSIDNSDPEHPLVIAKPGWYINASSFIPVFSDFQVFPKIPYRVFAGAPTWFYKFESEMQFSKLMADNNIRVD